MKPWRGLWKALFTLVPLASAPAQARARCYGHMEGLVCLSWLEVLTGLACGEEVPGLLVCTQHYQNGAWAGEAMGCWDQSMRTKARGTGFMRERSQLRSKEDIQLQRDAWLFTSMSVNYLMVLALSGFFLNLHNKVFKV